MEKSENMRKWELTWPTIQRTSLKKFYKKKKSNVQVTLILTLKLLQILTKEL